MKKNANLPESGSNLSVIAKYKHNQIEEYYFQGNGDFLVYVSYFVQTKEYVSIEIKYNGDISNFSIIDGNKETEYYKVLQNADEIKLEDALKIMNFEEKVWDDFITYTYVRLYHKHSPIERHTRTLVLEEREDYVPDGMFNQSINIPDYTHKPQDDMLDTDQERGGIK